MPSPGTASTGLPAPHRAVTATPRHGVATLSSPSPTATSRSILCRMPSKALI
uniref:Uncharacterized protein n=1 Tax=Setaria italica TaxID=4555 RepID=K4APJ3_SETIT